MTQRAQTAATVADRCQLWSAEICGTPVCALVTNGSAVTDAGNTLSGRRLVTACCGEHLAARLAAT